MSRRWPAKPRWRRWWTRWGGLAQLRLLGAPGRPSHYWADPTSALRCSAGSAWLAPWLARQRGERGQRGRHSRWRPCKLWLGPARRRAACCPQHMRPALGPSAPASRQSTSPAQSCVVLSLPQFPAIYEEGALRLVHHSTEPLEQLAARVLAHFGANFVVVGAVLRCALLRVGRTGCVGLCACLAWLRLAWHRGGTTRWHCWPALPLRRVIWAAVYVPLLRFVRGEREPG